MPQLEGEGCHGHSESLQTASMMLRESWPARVGVRADLSVAMTDDVPSASLSAHHCEMLSCLR